MRIARDWERDWKGGGGSGVTCLGPSKTEERRNGGQGKKSTPHHSMTAFLHSFHTMHLMKERKTEEIDPNKAREKKQEEGGKKRRRGFGIHPRLQRRSFTSFLTQLRGRRKEEENTRVVNPQLTTT